MLLYQKIIKINTKILLTICNVVNINKQNYTSNDNTLISIMLWMNYELNVVIVSWDTKRLRGLLKHIILYVMERFMVIRK